MVVKQKLIPICTDCQRKKKSTKLIILIVDFYELGFKPNLFAYPYGEYDIETIEVIRESDFVAAFGQHLVLHIFHS